MSDVKKKWVCRRCGGAGTVVFYVVNTPPQLFTCESCHGRGVVYLPLRPKPCY